MKKKNASSILLLLLCAARLTAADIISAVSPGKQIVLTVIQKDNQLYYTVAFKGTPVILLSPLLMKVDDGSLTAGVTAGKPLYYSIHETYPLWGVHATAHNDCNGMKLPLKNKKQTDTLEIRV